MKPPPWNILWVKADPLHPPDTGGKIRTLNMLREINRRHRLTYLALCAADSPLHPDEDADPYAAEKIWVPVRQPRRGSPVFFADLALSMASSKPFALSKHHSAQMRQRLIELDESGRFDLIVCDFLAPALHFVDRRWKTPVVLFQHNMESQIWKRMAANHPKALGRWFMAIQHRRMFAWENKLSRLFNGVITVSAEDSRFARETYGLANVLGDVPPGVDTHFFQPQADDRARKRPALAFLGSMDWMPNIEGVRWFVRDSWPLIKAQAPEARLRIVGRKPGPEIMALSKSDPSIEITGTVADVRPHLRDATAMIVPLLSGGGTRIKILEAMALGLPVISTTVGAEGLPFTHGRRLLLADQARSFADECLSLLRDGGRCQQLAEAARDEVVARYSWAAAAEKFLALAEGAA